MNLRAEYRPFHEPWHAQIFALTVHLNKQGHFDWKDWSKVFSDALSSKGSKDLIINDDDYYSIWLRTLEEFLGETTYSCFCIFLSETLSIFVGK